MATVTRKFRDDFETWAEHKKAAGAMSAAEIEELRQTLRADFSPGPDTLRAGLTIHLADGCEIPAAIDDHEERYRLWADFFAAEAEAIQQSARATR